ncbi:MAG TPA: hypothetical protein VGB84_03525 [Arachidicoccus sp.]
MQYQLSRNNIVTGPYSKETLIKHGILQTDMIKEEGGSEWRMPKDFVEFKDVISDSKPKYKITANKEVVEIKNEETKEVSASEMPANSPFKRMPSAVPKKKISNNTVGAAEKNIPKKEVISTTIKHIANTVDTAPHTEKAVYRKNVKPLSYGKVQARENSTNVTKEIFAPLLIVGSIGIATWFGYKKFSASSSAPSALQTVVSDTMPAAKKAIDSTKVVQLVAIKKHIVDSAIIYARRDSIQRVVHARRDSLALIAKVSNDAKIDSIQSKNIVVSKVAETKSIQPISETKKSETTVDKETLKPAEKKVVVKKKTISDYVALSLNKESSKEVKNMKINVKNISGQILNIAVIDVSYLDANGNFLKGETLQAENIGVGKTASVKVPNDKTAASISYKVSLISGDSVYLMGK